MIILFAVFAVFAVLMVFIAYRQGLKDAKPLAEKKEVKPFFSYKPDKDRKLSPAEQLQRAEADFVDNFQG